MAQKQGIIIKTDGTIEDTTIDGLKDMQAIVGGLIERACSVEDADMWCNEEGLLLHFPINHKATELRAKDGDALLSRFPVVGDVLILGACDHCGDSGNVSQAARDAVAAV